MDDDGGSSLETVDRRTSPSTEGAPLTNFGAEYRTVCKNSVKY